MNQLKKVLVIDDSKTTQGLIKKVLSKLPDLDLIQAFDGKEGISSIIENRDLDLVLIDITMPKINGIEVLKLINKTMPDRKFKICMLSARNTMDYVTNCLEFGCDDYIIKPFDISRFSNKIKYFLGTTRKKEITTTYQKKVQLEASPVNSPFKVPLLITKITEYDLYFISPIKVLPNTTLSIKINSFSPVFEKKDSINLIIRSFDIIDNKFHVTARFIDLTKNEENELRAFVIKN